MTAHTTPYAFEDRQWDMRVNVPTDEDLQRLRAAVKAADDAGRFTYCLIGGVEVGDTQGHGDYEIKHVHCAFMFRNRISHRALLKLFNIKTGNGYYIAPRKRNLPYKGWREHHTKERTKLDPDSLIIYENGSLPIDKPTESANPVRRSELEKKRKLDEIILDMRDMYERGEEEACFQKYPRNTLTYGPKLKAMMVQKRDFFKRACDPNLWLWGNPGTGKSALLEFIYPKSYKKNMDNRFFDLLKDNHHTHIVLSDVDHAVIEKLGVQFLKTICDEGGFPIDQKYLTPQLISKPVMVTSNYILDTIIPEDLKGRTECVRALARRFFQVRISSMLRLLGLRLLDRYELAQLKKDGNQDPSACFIAWDYVRECPAGEPLKSPEAYQQIIRDAYYGTGGATAITSVAQA